MSVVRPKYEDGEYQGAAARHALNLAERIQALLPEEVRADDATSILLSAACDSFVFATMIAISGLSSEPWGEDHMSQLSRNHKEMLKDLTPVVEQWVKRDVEERKRKLK